MKYLRILILILVSMSACKAYAYDLQSMTNKGASNLKCANPGATETDSWTNNTGQTLYVTEGYVWAGINPQGSSFDFPLKLWVAHQDGTQTRLVNTNNDHSGAWVGDVGNDNLDFNFSPNDVAVAPGDSINLLTGCTGPYPWMPMPPAIWVASTYTVWYYTMPSLGAKHAKHKKK